jgi:manganese efflux pump family protein
MRSQSLAVAHGALRHTLASGAADYRRWMNMPILELLGIAVGLAMDATAVAIAASIMLGRVSGRQVFRFAFHFGLFQALMPVLGWFAGRSFAGWITSWDHWLAFALLVLIGGKGLWQALHDDAETISQKDPTRGFSLIGLSVATSIDAMAVGLSFALLDVAIWWPAALIGIITAALVIVAMLLGQRIGARGGRWMGAIGGVVLIAIGVKILLEHLL